MGSQMWKVTTIILDGTAVRWKTTGHGWTTSIKYIRKSVWDFLNMDVKELLLITVQIRHAKITVKSIRHCIMSTWQRCLRSVHGSGPVMYGICLTSVVQPETKAV